MSSVCPVQRRNDPFLGRCVVVVPREVNDWNFGDELRDEPFGESDVIGTSPVGEIASHNHQIRRLRDFHRIDVVVTRRGLQIEISANEYLHGKVSVR